MLIIIKKTNIMFKYSKSVTISRTELEALRGLIESGINNKMGQGCNNDTFHTLRGLSLRLKNAKQ